MDNNINIKPSSKGFSSTNTVYLKKTRDTHIKINAFHIPDKKNEGKIHHYTIDLSVWKRKSGTKDFEPFLNQDKDFKDAVSKQIRITDKDAIKNLSDFLNSQNKLIGQKVDHEIVITDKEEFVEISNIKDLLQKSNLSLDELENLDGIINIKKFSTSKDSLEKLIEYLDNENINFLDHAKSDPLTCLYEANQKEKFFQNWIESNLWIFGTSYIRKLDKTNLSFSSDSDIVMETLDGFYELIEVKLPSAELFRYDKNHKSYYPSPALSAALGQVLKYLQDVDEFKPNIEKANQTTVLFPKAKLIIGKEPIENGEKEALRRFNSSLNNIEILTYDNLIKNAEKLIEIYKSKVS